MFRNPTKKATNDEKSYCTWLIKYKLRRTGLVINFIIFEIYFACIKIHESDHAGYFARI